MSRVFIAPVSGPCVMLTADDIPFWLRDLDRKLRGV